HRRDVLGDDSAGHPADWLCRRLPGLLRSGEYLAALAGDDAAPAQDCHIGAGAGRDHRRRHQPAADDLLDDALDQLHATLYGVLAGDLAREGSGWLARP